MDIYIPVLGLNNELGLDDIQPVTLLNPGRSSRSTLPPFSNLSQKMINILGMIDQIFYTCEEKELNGIFQFPNLNNPAIFQGQEDIESIGLGLLVKGYDLIIKKEDIPQYDFICVTGVLKKFPTLSEISQYEFLDTATDHISEKLDSFKSFIKDRDMAGKKGLFLYCGTADEMPLRNKLPENLAIKKIINFKDLLEVLYYPRKKTKKKSILIFMVCLIAALFASGVITSVIQPWKKCPPEVFTPSRKWDGGGRLLNRYVYTKSPPQLFLPGEKGYILTSIEEVNLKTNPFMNITAMGSALNNGFYLEIKNKADELIHGKKMKIEFPYTDHSYKSFTLDFSSFIHDGDKRASLIVFSDPEDPIYFRKISFGPKPAEKSVLLKYDGRRFTARERVNLLSLVNFRKEGNILVEQEEALFVEGDEGYIWSFLPEIDLNIYTILFLKVKTPAPCSINLELKFREEDREMQLLGEGSADRMEIELPGTGERFRLISLPLKIKEEMRDNAKAHVMAFSGAGKKIVFSEIYFGM